MKPSRVVSVFAVLALAVGVGWAQVSSFPPASVTGMGNFPAASATSMGHPAPWTINNGFPGASIGGHGHGRGHRPHRGLGAYWNYGGYGWGYYVSPWVTPVPDEVLGGSFYNDVNSRMNGRFYADESQPTEQAPVQQQAVQQPAPVQPMVFIIDRDGNMKQADYSQLKQRPTAPASQPQAQANTNATPPQPTVEDIKTVLVYRDGHRREITNYAIMGNKVYISPHGTVPLSELDIPATVAANDERGVDFRVPNTTP